MKHCVIFILIGLLVTSCIHGDYWDLGNGYSYCERSICKQDEKGVDTLVLFPEIIDYAYNERYIVAYQNLILLHLIMILFGSERKLNIISK